MIRALLLLAAALPAWAQQAPTPPAEPKKEVKETERRPLNLRLDNAGSFATTAPEKEPEKDLPSLGQNARKLPPAPAAGERGSAFPKDTNPGIR